MNKDKMTLQQLARACGVSIATVSRVLNGGRLVAPETRRRVLDAAQRSGYDGHWKLSGRPRVALISGHWRDHFWPRMLELLSEELERKQLQYEIIPLTQLALLDRRAVNGTFLMVPPSYLPADWPDDLPTVSLNSVEDRAHGRYSVDSDTETGIELAVRHLYGLGHRRIALTTVSSVAKIDQLRTRHFKDAVGRCEGLEGLVMTDPQLMARLARLRYQGVTGVLVPSYNDVLPAYQALALLNWRVPSEVSVIVQGDSRLTDYLLPVPTEIRIDLTRLCREAVDMLLALIRGETVPERVTVGYDLIVRDSTAPPPDRSA